MKRYLLILIVLTLIPSYAFSDGMFNNGGVFSKGSGGTECVTAACNLNASTTQNSKSICLSDGTHCPASSSSAAGGTNAVQYNSGSSTFAGDETKFSFNGTNVGIGTTNGLALFSINSSATQDLFRVDDSVGSDSTPFIIDQTGNVGIGSANPSAVLSISSTLVQDLFRIDDNGSGDLSPFLVDKDGNVGIGTANTQSDKLLVMGGNVGIGTWVPAAPLDVVGNIRTGTSVFANNIGIGTNITDNAGLTILYGNLGIGTWAPSNKVDIRGASATLRVFDTGNTATAIQVQNGSNAMALNASTAMLYNINNGILALGTNNGEKMRIDNNGNIGIGTTKAAGAFVVMNTQGGTGNVGIGTWAPEGIFTVVGGNVGIGTRAPKGAFVVLGYNVGIGTWAPKSSVEIRALDNQKASTMISGDSGMVRFGKTIISAPSNGATTRFFQFTDYNDTTEYFSWDIDTVGNPALNLHAKDLTIGKAPGGTFGELFRFAQTGNLGIGTSTAFAKIGIVGNIGIGTNANNNYLITSPPNGGMIVEGNVGIGSITPGQMLDVTGTIRASTDIKVSTNSVCQSNGTNCLSQSTNAVSFVSYQPGLLSAINATIGVNYLFSKASTVDNIIGSAVTFSCVANPTITMYECGTSTTCAAPTTIGTVTVTAAGTLVVGSISNAAITAGDYIGWAITAGTCASIDIAATAQVHSN